MSLTLFLRGLVVVVLVFAITTYLITGSLWSTFIQTVICAILVQAGYFAAVLFLVWRSDRRQKGEAGVVKSEATDEQSTAKVGELHSRLPGAGPSPS
jgi:exopolysaccharide production repressor protein